MPARSTSEPISPDYLAPYWSFWNGERAGEFDRRSDPRQFGKALGLITAEVASFTAPE